MEKRINFIATFNQAPVKITFASLAKAVGVSKNTVTTWYHGGKITKGKNEKLIKFFKEYNIPVIYQEN